MAPYGFSTGALYRIVMPLEEKIDKLHTLGASAIELGIITPEVLRNFRLTPELRKMVKRFDYISIHGPFIEARYGRNGETKEVTDRLRELCDELPVGGIVVHPDLVDDFEALEKTGLPIIIENMDRRHTVGISPEYIRKLKDNYDFGFVLDLQHAYEQDTSMSMAKEMIEVMGGRLRHMHVSGCLGEDGHVPVHMAENRDNIVRVLQQGIRVPKIFEGVFVDRIDRTISRELSFVGKYER
jgi:sugar phosphate isomerase/epimerase